MIVAVAGIKGGTGKTTLATNLAVYRAMNASDVLLVDTDTQGSSMDFSQVREENNLDPSITVSSLTGKQAGSEVNKLSPKFDDVVVDVGGRDTSAFRMRTSTC